MTNYFLINYNPWLILEVEEQVEDVEDHKKKNLNDEKSDDHSESLQKKDLEIS